jgi:hypothetical protein
MREILLFLFIYGPLFFVLLPLAVFYGLAGLLEIFPTSPANRVALHVAFWPMLLVGFQTMKLLGEPRKQLLNLGFAVGLLLIFTLFHEPAGRIIAFGPLAGAAWALSAEIIAWLWFWIEGFWRPNDTPEPFPFGWRALNPPKYQPEKDRVNWNLAAEPRILETLALRPGLSAPQILETLGGDATLAKLRPLLAQLCGEGKLGAGETEFGKRYYLQPKTKPGG